MPTLVAMSAVRSSTHMKQNFLNVILKQSFVKFIYLSLVTVMAEGGLCLFSISQPVSPSLANPKSMTTLLKIWHEHSLGLEKKN